MQLSPITSYYLRKLMRRRRDRLQSLPDLDVDLTAERRETNIETALHSLYQEQSDMGNIVQKLEGLVSLHQALEKQGTIYSKDLASVEESIFHMLGFQVSSAA